MVQRSVLCGRPSRRPCLTGPRGPRHTSTSTGQTAVDTVARVLTVMPPVSENKKVFAPATSTRRGTVAGAPGSSSSRKYIEARSRAKRATRAQGQLWVVAYAATPTTLLLWRTKQTKQNKIGEDTVDRRGQSERSYARAIRRQWSSGQVARTSCGTPGHGSVVAS